MKKSFAVLAGVGALGLAVYFGGGLLAQQPAGGGQAAAPAAAPLRTRIALINTNKVINELKRFQAFREEFKANVKGYEDKLATISKQVEQYRAAGVDPKVDQATRDKYEKEVKNLQRQAQDIQDEMKQGLGKREADMLVVVYKEIQEAAQVYARARDIELVLHYKDVADLKDSYNPFNVQRKLTSDGLVPLYDGGMDITAIIIDMLNTHYGRTNPAAAQPGGAPVQPASATSGQR